MLEIATGLLRGLRLKSPKGQQTRPTSERIRQSIFNILSSKIFTPDQLQKIIVCDLFAGSGALGLEALSHGACEAWFIDEHALAHACLKENLSIVVKSMASQNLDEPVLYLLKKKTEKVYPELPEFDVVFSDPPYNKSLARHVFELEERYHRIRPGGILVTECHVDEKSGIEELSLGSLTLIEFKTYGDTVVFFHEKKIKL